MLIDWFTLAAQIVNFLILVWLLKRFLWERLIRAIDGREKHLAARLAEANEKNQEADRRVDEIATRATEQERQHDEFIAIAKREANEVRLELTQQARADVRKQEARWREDLEREKTAFLDEVRQRVSSEVLAIVRRALADLACADIQRCTTQVFLERIRTAEMSSLLELARGGTVNVLTAEDLPAETRREIEAVLAARLGRPVRLEFLRRPTMSWGIELRSNGRSIGWTPESYLDSLNEGLHKALDVRPKALVG